MQNSSSSLDLTDGKGRRKTVPHMPFYPFGEGQEEHTSQQKRKTLIKVWLFLLFANMLLLIIISIWAVHRSHKKDEIAFGTCYLAPRIPGDRRVDKNKITFVNFNAEWLFMRGGHGEIQCPSESCPWANREEAVNHMRRVARVLSELDADIINLNEVEDCKVMEELLNMMPRGHGYKFYLIQGDDHATGQNPGILTRLDPVMNLRHSSDRIDFPVEGSSCRDNIVGATGCTKHYLTKFKAKNSRGIETSFILAGLHLLAKPLDRFRCGRREAQALLIKQLIEEVRRRDDKIIVAGDFNDYDNETPGPNDDKSISRTLDILKSELDLKNTASIIPRNERYSCWFDKDQNCIDSGREEHTLIDHVLVSEDWTVLGASFYHKYQVSCRDRVSDHWPFKVTLKI